MISLSSATLSDVIRKLRVALDLFASREKHFSPRNDGCALTCFQMRDPSSNIFFPCHAPMRWCLMDRLKVARVSPYFESIRRNLVKQK